MESAIIWLTLIIISLIVVVPYFKKFRSEAHRAAERKKEAASLGADKPIAQHPMIDLARCIGCGSCVDACPEGEVLGLVHGKATIINGLKCVGHGLCEDACPVGALKVGLGDVTTRDDIPIMNEHNETSIPGLYIAGELGGLALIRNALAQGARVVERIHTQVTEKRKGIWDVVIVGAGPAGISAALTAIKNKMTYVMIDRQPPGGTILHYPRKKLVMTQPVNIPLYGKLTKHEYYKEELVEIWEEIHHKFKLNIMVGEKLSNIVREDGYLAVETDKHVYKGQTVVMALGRRGMPRKLGVPGEEKAKVMYKLMDAETYQGEHILVVGGGDSAIEAAIALGRQKGNTVTISYRKEKFFRMKQKNEKRILEMIEKGQVTPLFSSSVKEIRDDEVDVEVSGEMRTIKNDYIFVLIGGIPPFKMMKEMGIKFGGEQKDLQ